MPWSASDAQRHTAKADSPALQRLWAKIANQQLAEHGDEGRAVRIANAAIAEQRKRPRSRIV